MKRVNPAEGSYRLRLIEELHREVCARGLYKTILPPKKPDPNSEFRIVVDDVLRLLDALPPMKEGSLLDDLRPKIRAALDTCQSDLVRNIPESDIYHLMCFADERSSGNYQPSEDELAIGG